MADSQHHVGLAEHGVSYINATDLHTVDMPRLHRRRGLLSPGEMARLEDAIRLVPTFINLVRTRAGVFGSWLELPGGRRGWGRRR